jgi:hypothetical protein
VSSKKRRPQSKVVEMILPEQQQTAALISPSSQSQ